MATWRWTPLTRLVLGVVGLIGTGNLVGQLSVDAVFDASDAADDQVFKGCAPAGPASPRARTRSCARPAGG